MYVQYCSIIVIHFNMCISMYYYIVDHTWVDTHVLRLVYIYIHGVRELLPGQLANLLSRGLCAWPYIHIFNLYMEFVGATVKQSENCNIIQSYNNIVVCYHNIITCNNIIF